MKTKALGILGLILLTASSYAQSGNPRFRRAKEPVPNAYIVKLADSLSDVPGLARALERQHAVRVDRIWTMRPKALAITASENQVLALLNTPFVEWIEEDAVVRLSGAPPTPYWHLDRLDQRTRPLNGTYGICDDRASISGAGYPLRVYVIDSGIRASHQEFTTVNAAGTFTKVVSGHDFANDCGYVADLNPCIDQQFPASSTHGTAVASLIAGHNVGVVEQATLVSVRAFNRLGQSTISMTRDAIDLVRVDHEADKMDGHWYPRIANMSFYWDAGDAGVNMFVLAVQELIASGVVVVASANNQQRSDICNDSTAQYPAAIPGVITVAGISEDGGVDGLERAWYGSNLGPCVDIFAPAENVISADGRSDSGYRTLIQDMVSGTSFSAPIVSGWAANQAKVFFPGRFGTPSYSAADIWSRMQAMATVNQIGGNNLFGAPNRLIYTGDTAACLP